MCLLSQALVYYICGERIFVYVHNRLFRHVPYTQFRCRLGDHYWSRRGVVLYHHCHRHLLVLGKSGLLENRNEARMEILPSDRISLTLWAGDGVAVGEIWCGVGEVWWNVMWWRICNGAVIHSVLQCQTAEANFAGYNWNNINYSETNINYTIIL